MAITTGQYGLLAAAQLIHQTDADGCHIVVHTDGNHITIGGDGLSPTTGYTLDSHVDFHLDMPPGTRLWAIDTQENATLWKLVTD